MTTAGHTIFSHRVFGGKVRELSYSRVRAVRQHATADNVRMETLIRHARQVCTTLAGAAAVMVTMAAAAAPAAPSATQTQRCTYSTAAA